MVITTSHAMSSSAFLPPNHNQRRSVKTASSSARRRVVTNERGTMSTNHHRNALVPLPTWPATFDGAESAAAHQHFPSLDPPVRRPTLSPRTAPWQLTNERPSARDRRRTDRRRTSWTVAATARPHEQAFLQAWYPCTQGGSLLQYISREENGPFLRTLRTTWLRLGSPVLESVRELGHSTLTGGEGEEEDDDDDDDDDDAPLDLDMLCVRQERSIALAISTAMHTTQPFTSPKPFDTFAAQVGLFSAIKAELQAIEQKSNTLEHRTRLYHDVWRQHMISFDRRRSATCAVAVPQNHSCLGQLIWGEAYMWPVQALQLAYLGYSLPLGGAPASSGTDWQSIPSPTSTNGVHALAPPPPPHDPASSSSAHSSSSLGTPRTRPSSTPGTAFSSDAHTTPPPKSDSLDAAAMWHVWADERRASQLLSSGTRLSRDNSLAYAATTPYFLPRRPTLTEFWDHGLSILFDANAASTAHDGPLDDDPFAVLAGSASILANDWPGPSSHHAPEEDKQQALSVASSSDPSSPASATAVNVSPSHMQLHDNMTHMGLGHARLHGFSDLSTTMLSSPVEERDGSGIRGTYVQSPVSTSSTNLFAIAEPLSATTAAGLPFAPVSIEPTATPFRPVRPTYRTRTSTMSSDLSRTSSSTGSTRGGRGGGGGGAGGAFNGKLRSQRHYARLMTQRTLLNEVIMRMQQTANMLFASHCRRSSIVERIRSALFFKLETTSNAASDVGQETTNGGGNDTSISNRRKRESKKRLRDNDLQNMMIVARLAATLVNVPMDRLIACLTMHSRLLRVDGSSDDKAIDDEVIHALLLVWLEFKHGWGDLIMAEKRNAPRLGNGNRPVTVMLQLLRIALGDLSDPGSMDAEREEQEEEEEEEEE